MLMGEHLETDEQGWVVKAKSRLAARGFKQREGIYFGETFARTVLSSCVRILSTIACECGLDMYHFDVDQEFVQSRLDVFFSCAITAVVHTSMTFLR